MRCQGDSLSTKWQCNITDLTVRCVMENYAIEIVLAGMTVSGAGVDMAAYPCFSPVHLVGLGKFVSSTGGPCFFVTSAPQKRWPFSIDALGWPRGGWAFILFLALTSRLRTTARDYKTVPIYGHLVGSCSRAMALTNGWLPGLFTCNSAGFL